jgi:hypothetical protein
MSSLLSSAGKTPLSAQWTITPVGGSDKVPTFVALLGAQRGLKLATLLDIQKKDTQTVENLYKRKLLSKKNVLTYADFTGSSEADVEDMFGVDFYLRLVNEEFQRNLASPISPANLKNKAPRILVRLDQYFEKVPMVSGASFNHFRPARYFAENLSTLSKHIPSEALDRFDAVFTTLNSLL